MQDLSMKLFLFLSILLCASLIVAEEAKQEEKKDERRPSMFKIGEDWLALPEVFSTLDFAADSTPAEEGDIEGQLRLRASRFWGRLYIDGWPQTIQFFRAHFGIEPPLGKKRFVFAEPRDACVPLTNGHLLTADHVLLVNRGNCTFGTKAINTHKTAAKAIIIINNEPGLEHLPGPDAHDLQYSVSSIPQPEGLLLEQIYDEGPADGGFGRRIEGYMVPINCENSGARCVPATYEERNNIKTLAEGGTVHVYNTDGSPSSSVKDSDHPMEYLLAHFGVKVPHESTKGEVIIAKPAEACAAIENDIKGKYVLVRRGGCPFVKKAEHIQAAGGKLMIVGSMHPYIVRMGVEPRWKGLNTAIPVVMVSKRTYSILVAESFTHGLIALSESNTVNSTVWEPLEKLYNGEGWPRSDVYIKKKADELLEQEAKWLDRVATINEAYTKRTKPADAKEEL